MHAPQLTLSAEHINSGLQLPLEIYSGSSYI